MAEAFRIEIGEGVAVITFDLPGSRVNILTRAVMEELERVVTRLEEGPEPDGAILCSGKADNFIAGADIGEIEALRDPAEGTALSERGQALLERIEKLPFPVVAAIHGACLGGGLELALACRGRVASSSPRTFLGLPETRLGIVPGFGGTQRLPRLVGIPEALRMITSGARVFPKKALRIGLVDEVVEPEHLMEAARRAIRDRRSGRRRPRRFDAVSAFLGSNRFGRKLLFDRARRSIREKAGDHYPALPAAVEAVEAGYSHGLEDGYAEEAHLLGETAVSEVSKNLIRVFRLREHYARVEQEPAADVVRMGVLGAGVMGGGIAALAAEKGFRVRLVDMSAEALGQSLRRLDRSLAKKARKGVYSRTEADWIRARLGWDTRLRGLGTAQVLLEAVAERMDVKKAVLAELSGCVAGDAVIVSNTSSLSVTEMAGAVPNPGRVAGMHFFNPVDRMELVEVVRAEETADETVARVSALAARLGKIPVVVADRPGFLVNRLLFAFLNEAVRLLEQGLTVETVDAALRDFGMPMGAFELLDVVGLDIAAHAAGNLHRGLGERMKPAHFIGVFRDGGRLGRKNGRGFYRWDGKGGRRPDPEALRLLRRHAPAASGLDAPEIVERTILPMLNEAALCLEEGVVDHPGAVDVAMIFGAGFPPFRGGLCRYGDTLGADRVVEGLRRLERDLGGRFRPAELLVEMARSGRGFFTEEAEESARGDPPDTG